MYLLSHLLLRPKCESLVVGNPWKNRIFSALPPTPLLPMMMNGLRVLVSREHVKKFTSICKQPTRTYTRDSGFPYFWLVFCLTKSLTLRNRNQSVRARPEPETDRSRIIMATKLCRPARI